MDFIMELSGAMLLVSAAMVALTIATIFVYATVVLIISAAKDKKKAKKGKK